MLPGFVPGSVLMQDTGGPHMADTTGISRRGTLQSLGALGTAAMFGSAGGTPVGASEEAPRGLSAGGRLNPAIAEKVFATPLIDTHEHLIEEKERLSGTAHPRCGPTTGACC